MRGTGDRRPSTTVISGQHLGKEAPWGHLPESWDPSTKSTPALVPAKEGTLVLVMRRNDGNGQPRQPAGLAEAWDSHRVAQPQFLAAAVSFMCITPVPKHFEFWRLECNASGCLTATV